MFLTNLTTALTKTATTTSFALVVPADRLGLGCGTEQNGYPADDSLSRGHIPVPANPKPEQLRSRQQGQSAQQMRKQLRTDSPDAVPPTSSVGSVPSVARVNWRTPPADTTRNRNRSVPANSRNGDCHSPVRLSANNGTKPEALADRANGK
jgi:hypothetical protein